MEKNRALSNDISLVPFAKAIAAIQPPHIPIWQVESEAEKNWINGNYAHWIGVAHWVIHYRLGLYDKRQFPLNAEPVKSAEPWGRLLSTQLNLCIGCHDANEQTLYNNGYEWWTETVREIDKSSFMQIFGLQHGKRAHTEGLRSNLKKLKAYENPYSDRHHQELAKVAIELAQRSHGKPTGFYRDYWQPFLRAYQGCINEVHRRTDKQMLVLDGDTLRYQAGQGKHQPKVKVEYIEWLKPVVLTV